MKASELRQWVGKEIEWDDLPDDRGWYRTWSGRVMDVQGRNVLVDDKGSHDWKWLPKMRNVRLKSST